MTGAHSELFAQFGRTFSAGQAIFSEGESASECFLIEAGRVRLVKRIRSSERSLTVLGPGDLFGEDALLPKALRSASAVALTDLEVLALDQQTFAVMLSGNAEIASRLVEQLVRRLRDAEEQLENAMLADHPSRVITRPAPRRCERCCREERVAPYLAARVLQLGRPGRGRSEASGSTASRRLLAHHRGANPAPRPRCAQTALRVARDERRGPGWLE